MQADIFVCRRLFSTNAHPSFTKKVFAALPVAGAGLFVKTSGTTYKKPQLIVAVGSRVEHNLDLCWESWAALRADATINWPTSLTKDKINRTTEAEGAGNT